MLAPVLGRNTIKRGRMFVIKLGDKEVPKSLYLIIDFVPLELCTTRTCVFPALPLTLLAPA